MQRALITIFVVVLMAAWCGYGLAEVYYYRDENGVMVFSDTPPDSDTVAPEQVEVAREPEPSKAYKTPTPKPASTPRTSIAPPRTPVPDLPGQKPVSGTNLGPTGHTDEELEAYFDRLSKLRRKTEQLKKEREELVAEGKELMEKAKKIKRRSAMRVQNRRVQELNDRITTLDARVAAHKEEYEAFLEKNKELRLAAEKQGATP